MTALSLSHYLNHPQTRVSNGEKNNEGFFLELNCSIYFLRRFCLTVTTELLRGTEGRRWLRWAFELPFIILIVYVLSWYISLECSIKNPTQHSPFSAPLCQTHPPPTQSVPNHPVLVSGEGLLLSQAKYGRSGSKQGQLGYKRSTVSKQKWCMAHYSSLHPM